MLLADQVFDDAHIVWIEVGGWLIEQQHFRFQDQGAGHGDSLHFSAGQRMRLGVAQMG